jgi:hypothetical protein
MTDRRITVKADKAQIEEGASLRHRHVPSSGLAERRARPQSPQEAEERYVAARNEWTAAMRKASSGKPADMAALAMAQEAYEVALAQRERWASSPRVAIPIEPDRPRGINAIVGQELSWRRVHQLEQAAEQPKGLRRLLRRFKGR